MSAIIAVVAHPDDEALIAGGTLALAAARGLRAGVVSLTRGELGPISDPALASTATLGAVRAHELQDSAAALGAWARCLEHPDGELPWTIPAAAAELTAILRPARPSVLLTFGEDGLYGHPDHVATRAIALQAAEALGAGGPCVYGAWWSPRLAPDLVAVAAARGLPTSLWGLEPQAFGSPPDGGPLTRVDAHAVVRQKLRALRAHRTQLDEGHLLTALPLDLARRFLGEEAWRTAGGPGRDVLADLLGATARWEPLDDD